MNTSILNSLLLGGSFLALFGTGELLYHFVKVQAEYTRKLIHFGTGLLTLLFPVLLENHWYVLLLCSMFAVLLTLSLRFRFLKSINAIDRKSHGSISYPAAVYGTFLACSMGFSATIPGDLRSYYIPVLLLAVCDPIAALAGKKLQWKPYRVGQGHKTLSGSIGFFIAAFLLSWALVHSCSGAGMAADLLVASSLALATTLAEAFSRNGLDNLFIPAAAILVLYLFAHHSHFYFSAR